MGVPPEPGDPEDETPTRPANRAAHLPETALGRWSVNDRPGLEHGFTLAPPPSGRNETGAKLEFDLTLRDNLRPEISPDGVGLCFRDERSGTTLTYAELRICDAEGRKLPARFAALPHGVRLAVETTGARYPITVDPLAQQAYLRASDAKSMDLLGQSVGISGETVLVGAPGATSNSTGLHRDSTEDRATDSGAVYVFVRNGGIWSQQARFKVSHPAAGDVFGFSLACSGNTLVLAVYGDAGNALG